jgi:hypothetical protein
MNKSETKPSVQQSTLFSTLVRQPPHRSNLYTRPSKGAVRFHDRLAALGLDVIAPSACFFRRNHRGKPRFEERLRPPPSLSVLSYTSIMRSMALCAWVVGLVAGLRGVVGGYLDVQMEP